MHKLLNLIPFVLMSTSSPFDPLEPAKVSLNFTRILEAVIMAVLGGAMSGYITLQVLSKDVSDLKSQLQSNAVETKSAINKVQDLVLDHIMNQYSPREHQK